MNRTNKSYKKSRQSEIRTVFNACQITKQVMLPITAVNLNLMSTLENVISEMVCGKCIVDGYVKPGSVQIITYSSGIMKNINVLFDVVFNCQVCFPVAGMKLRCIAKNITKAGIKAESAESDDGQSPFILYVARDHSYENKALSLMNVGDIFTAKVIDQRFELNDSHISIIAELDRETTRQKIQSVPFKPTIDF